MAEAESISIPAYVLDSYALLAYFQAEPGGPTVSTLIEAADLKKAWLHLSLINAGEMYYIMHRKQGFSQAEEMLKDLHKLPVTLHLPTKERIWAAARLKAEYPISYADAFAAALAQELGAVLVTGDSEFKSVEPGVTVMWLSSQ